MYKEDRQLHTWDQSLLDPYLGMFDHCDKFISNLTTVHFLQLLYYCTKSKCKSGKLNVVMLLSLPGEICMNLNNKYTMYTKKLQAKDLELFVKAMYRKMEPFWLCAMLCSPSQFAMAQIVMKIGRKVFTLLDAVSHRHFSVQTVPHPLSRGPVLLDN